MIPTYNRLRKSRSHLCRPHINSKCKYTLCNEYRKRRKTRRSRRLLTEGTNKKMRLLPSSTVN